MSQTERARRVAGEVDRVDMAAAVTALRSTRLSEPELPSPIKLDREKLAQPSLVPSLVICLLKENP